VLDLLDFLKGTVCSRVVKESIGSRGILARLIDPKYEASFGGLKPAHQVKGRFGSRVSLLSMSRLSGFCFKINRFSNFYLEEAKFSIQRNQPLYSRINNHVLVEWKNL